MVTSCTLSSTTNLLHIDFTPSANFLSSRSQTLSDRSLPSHSIASRPTQFIFVCTCVSKFVRRDQENNKQESPTCNYNSTKNYHHFYNTRRCIPYCLRNKRL
mmetsp:Transcript_23219/g.41699  ORF Transcript_23219/g.41699 Transcript_23219/m.41699 type:complete len:102 (-) Transcript_23219:6-311(-)